MHMMQHCIRVTTALVIASSTLLLHASLAGAQESIAIAPTDQISAPGVDTNALATDANNQACNNAKMKEYRTPSSTGTFSRGNETTTYIHQEQNWLPILRSTNTPMGKTEDRFEYSGNLWKDPFVLQTTSIFMNDGTMVGKPLVIYGQVTTIGRNVTANNRTEMGIAIICIESDLQSIISE